MLSRAHNGKVCCVVRICYLCNEYPPYSPGGIGTTVQQLARFMAGRGHEVHVVGVYRDLKETVREDDQGVKVWRVPRQEGVLKAKVRDMLSRWRLRRQVVRLIKEGGLDILEGHDYWGSLLFMPRSIPRVCRVHDPTVFAREESQEPLTWFDRLTRWSGYYATHFVAVSDYVVSATRQHWKIATRRPLIMIHNPLASCFFAQPQWRPSSRRIIFTGTLNARKGVPELLDAWLSIKDRWPEHTLHLYGKPGDSDSSVQTVASSLENRVVCHGHVSQEELAIAFQQAYCGVFPSQSETFGLGPAEAVAAGLPVIVTRISGFQSVLEEGKDALMCEPNDSHALAGALTHLLSNPDEVRSLVLAGANRMRRYHIDVIGPQNEAFYESVIGQRRL